MGFLWIKLALPANQINQETLIPQWKVGEVTPQSLDHMMSLPRLNFYCNSLMQFASEIGLQSSRYKFNIKINLVND